MKYNTQIIAGLICKSRGHMITLKRVMEKTGLDHKPTIRIMDKFLKKGFLEVFKVVTKESRKGISNNPVRYPTWKILDRKRICEAVACPGKNGKGQVRDRIWKAIRMRRIFTAPEIQELSGRNINSIRDYTTILAKHKIVKKTGRGRQGTFWQLTLANPPVKRPNLSEAA